jgi:UMP-CMP kinase
MSRYIVWMLGAGGSGKSEIGARLSQCKQASAHHISAGQLLRDAVSSGKHARIESMLSSGQIVPSSVTVSLLDECMAAKRRQRREMSNLLFLIDGFPRNEENREAFVSELGVDCDATLLFDCDYEVLRKRLRARGRHDDSDGIVQRRFDVFERETMPVVQHYERLGRLARIDANQTIEQVYSDACQVLTSIVAE